MQRKLYFGGPILTMDRDHPRAEALLTEGGRITAVGSLAEIDGGDAKRVDLKGRCLMPAFVDGHSHLSLYGAGLIDECSLWGCESFDDMLRRIREFACQNAIQPGESILCTGYDLSELREGRHPTAALLDSLNLPNPIGCIHRSRHVGVYNTIAMEKLGVLEPDYRCPEGGFVGRDESGRPNGYFEEKAREAFDPLFAAESSHAHTERAVLAGEKQYLENGFATVQDGGSDIPHLMSYLQLDGEGKLTSDVVFYLTCSEEEYPRWGEMKALMEANAPQKLHLGGVKMFLDGSPQVRTAWLSKPYEGETEYRGYPVMTDDEVELWLERAAEHRFQPMAHCNGDAASEQFLSCWERVLARRPEAKGLRPVMIHAQTVRADQLRRMAECGMMASFFVGHCWYWGDTHLKNLGERGERISPSAEALELGVPFSFHQDCPVTPPNMLHSVWCAVNRITKEGKALSKALRLTPYEALIAATRGAAYGYFKENSLGILAPGAAADLVILGEDPTAVDPMTIKDIPILCTIKGGEPVYGTL